MAARRDTTGVRLNWKSRRSTATAGSTQTEALPQSATLVEFPVLGADGASGSWTDGAGLMARCIALGKLSARCR